MTVVTHGRSPLFGRVDADAMHLNQCGYLIEREWTALPSRFPDVDPDAFVVMPNHLHGILWLKDPGNVGAGLALPAGVVDGPVGREARTGQSAGRAPALGDVVGAFKSLSARAVNTAIGRRGPLWQRNYFERLIRHERELHAIRKYIDENPLRWALDKENPGRPTV